ncbi:MAG: dTDP-4-keto-6-deoxy-D-glucose epimerase [Burkholderiaceae bacterium]|nr:MAG: dTDP-4-keto-6-deoxy-D-glucose epimerase [Burkholderiaceae bacterium]
MTERFAVSDTPLSGLKLVQRQLLGDARGFLTRLFCAQELEAAGWTTPIAQINHTYTAARGTVRGLHFQEPPHAEMKLVSCLRGEVFDVALDLRQGSPTYLHWHAAHLSAANRCALLIPTGFAHGFQTLTDDVELLYCHSAAHAPEAERGLHPLDDRLGIGWPLPVVGLSPRDAAHTFLNFIDPPFTGVRL